MIPGQANKKELKRSQPNTNLSSRVIKSNKKKDKKKKFPNLEDHEFEIFFPEEETEVQQIYTKPPKGHYFESGYIKANPLKITTSIRHLVIRVLSKTDRNSGVRTVWVTLSKKLNSRPFYQFLYKRSTVNLHKKEKIQVAIFGEEFRHSMKQLIYFGSETKKLINFQTRKNLITFRAFRLRRPVDYQEAIDVIAQPLNQELQRKINSSQNADFRVFGFSPKFTYSRSPLSKELHAVVKPPKKGYSVENSGEMSKSAEILRGGLSWDGQRFRWFICREAEWKIIEQDYTRGATFRKGYRLKWQEIFDPAERNFIRCWNNGGEVWEQDGEHR